MTKRQRASLEFVGLSVRNARVFSVESCEVCGKDIAVHSDHQDKLCSDCEEAEYLTHLEIDNLDFNNPLRFEVDKYVVNKMMGRLTSSCLPKEGMK